MAKSPSMPFDMAITKTKEVLAAEDSGVLTDIGVKDTLKKKLFADWKPYRILGACNPPLAHQALKAEDKTGTMLPCNVVVREIDNFATEVAVVDPLDTMIHIGNQELTKHGKAEREKSSAALNRL